MSANTYTWRETSEGGEIRKNGLFLAFGGKILVNELNTLSEDRDAYMASSVIRGGNLELAKSTGAKA